VAYALQEKKEDDQDILKLLKVKSVSEEEEVNLMEEIKDLLQDIYKKDYQHKEERALVEKAAEERSTAKRKREVELATKSMQAYGEKKSLEKDF